MKLIVTSLLLLCSLSPARAAQTGMASWYGKENKVTCTGKPTCKHIPAAAHKHLPIGSYVKITSLKTNKAVVAIVEDRGPYTRNRIIDLNIIAARQIGIQKRGVSLVKIEALK